MALGWKIAEVILSNMRSHPNTPESRIIKKLGTASLNLLQGVLWAEISNCFSLQCFSSKIFFQLPFEEIQGKVLKIL